ncbi:MULTISPECIES: type II toxin-antitoxin system RelE/ParE family toxin [Enterobacter]|uniref:type II toxin-antitoxin system RelE/ParE family toxin n=1 Tax=Enterobacter TaxID=547 RepID=UPI001CBC3FFD|nr:MULTISPECIES: type II toxin-antitoxin system RelE/ParE family toxin [Enterobacter]UAN18759.1 type II toxin-antitoxin system RelE/ParE family toxin [Enterobacter asburiae]UAN18762.1 type II toxin-antitoxin system RelE/ParE family toxin [Enterobacter asburiae]UAN20348.1 type II toxin-antitoxin system RelE/ParE family toxin [Enterobacter sp. JBIWA003]UAN24669.1 type II toxin-antitoxin system RelE/ParE family toxin [Enterobacter sp. JBIWA003]UAN24673.1 type II toxin-antitoxin system RelE/ParE f
MSIRVEWEKRAQHDRENLFRYLNREAGAMVAIAADDRLAGMVTILAENPLAGVKAGGSEKQRKLVVPHFPFIVVYVAESARVRILRVLHTSRKIAGQYSQS